MQFAATSAEVISMSDRPGAAPDLQDLTAQVVSAHLRKAHLLSDALPDFIQPAILVPHHVR